jgi:hypothetical protein
MPAWLHFLPPRVVRVASATLALAAALALVNAPPEAEASATRCKTTWAGIGDFGLTPIPRFKICLEVEGERTRVDRVTASWIPLVGPPPVEWICDYRWRIMLRDSQGNVMDQGREQILSPIHYGCFYGVPPRAARFTTIGRFPRHGLAPWKLENNESVIVDLIVDYNRKYGGSPYVRVTD